MNKQTVNGFLELEVTDFGPIVKAKVDLRPLTVFVGPSNTGKSYLAILIYALHRVFGGDPRLRRRGFIDPGLPFRRGDERLSKASADALLEMARSFKLSSDSELRDQDTVVLPPLVADALRSMFDELAYGLSNEIGRCFGVRKSRALLRKGQTGPSRIVMRPRISDHRYFAEHRMSLEQEAEFKTTVPAEVPIPVREGIHRYLDLSYPMHLLDEVEWAAGFNQRDFVSREILSSLGAMVLPSLVGPLHLPAYYLPADRTGVMHAHNVVVSALIASAPTAGLRPATRTPTLSGVLADFLEQLIEIDRIGPTNRKAKERDLGRNIEQAILGGSVQVDRSTHIDYPSFAYRPHGWKESLALANASSMVSELAPVVLYLRHMIKPGNVLIVEEPESHLHPGMQVEFTRQIAALIEVGVRVIITTHSEWLLEELANIVRRSQLPKAERGDEPALRSDQVGVWLFEPKQRPKGSFISEIHLDESSLYPSGFDKVARSLHNEWADISSRLEPSP